MKTIHLKCGHDIRVKEWPSRAAMKKLREHNEKYHPKLLKKSTCKGLKTKKKRGLIKDIKTPYCNPAKIKTASKAKWYVGISINKSSKNRQTFVFNDKWYPNKKKYGNLFSRIVGPFSLRAEAEKFAKGFLK